MYLLNAIVFFSVVRCDFWLRTVSVASQSCQLSFLCLLTQLETKQLYPALTLSLMIPMHCESHRIHESEYQGAVQINVKNSECACTCVSLCSYMLYDSIKFHLQNDI